MHRFPIAICLLALERVVVSGEPLSGVAVTNCQNLEETVAPEELVVGNYSRLLLGAAGRNSRPLELGSC